MDAISDQQHVRHGDPHLPCADLRSYSLPIKAGDAFIGDLASGSEFRKTLRRERHRIECTGDPPFGDERTHDIDGEALDDALQARAGSAEAEVVENAVGAFSLRFADVLLQFLAQPEWAGTQRIVCGGGLMEGKVGRELVGRAERIVRQTHASVRMQVLHHEPDDAGMIGWAYAAPRQLLDRGNGYLAVDIGGTNIRWGIVQAVEGEAGNRSPHRVAFSDKWCHAREDVTRDELVEILGSRLQDAATRAPTLGVDLAPFVGLSCPGIVEPNGRIASGVQNLPGDWTAPDFHLPEAIASRIDPIGAQGPVVVLHNDAVIQALSETPILMGVENWAAVTLGTGLGNASFRNRSKTR